MYKNKLIKINQLLSNLEKAANIFDNLNKKQISDCITEIIKNVSR